nr:uncharacterized protein LOC117847577 [Setaria viridis]
MRARAKEASATSARRGPDFEGWWTVESWRSCRVRLRVSHQPRRTVPSDLQGRCFNCLSPEHLAVGCRSPPRCFHCRVLGHRSYDCGRRPLSPRSEPTLVRRKVWRLVRSLAVTTSVPVSSMETIQKDGTASGATRRRRQRCSRGRRTEAEAGQSSSHVPDLPPEEMVAGDVPNSATSEGEQAPTVLVRRILDHTVSMAQREEELSCALVVTVFGNSLDNSPESIKTTIVQCFGLDEEFDFLRLGAASFLMILSNGDIATRVYNGGRPIITQAHRLHIMRWSRFLHSTVAALPVPVEVELRGIPTHAWDVETAKQLLNEFCYVGGVLPDAADLFSVYWHGVFRRAASPRAWNWKSWNLQWREPIIRKENEALSILWRLHVRFLVRYRRRTSLHPCLRLTTKGVAVVGDGGGGEARRRGIRYRRCPEFPPGRAPQCIQGWGQVHSTKGPPG